MAAKVAAVWWMGGALGVRGNVDPVPGSSDGSAEWNAFWDPPAAAAVWGAGVPLLLVPLDATNTVPITRDLLYRFGPQAGRQLSLLAGTMWATVVTWDSERPGLPYYAWDTLTAACALAPPGSRLCSLHHGLLTAVCLQGAQQGRIVWLNASSRGSRRLERTSLSAGRQRLQEHERLSPGVPLWAAQAAAEACGCPGQQHLWSMGTGSFAGSPSSSITEDNRADDQHVARFASWGISPSIATRPGKARGGEQPAPAACVSQVAVVSAVLSADPGLFEDFVLDALNS